MFEKDLQNGALLNIHGTKIKLQDIRQEEWLTNE